jgi:hypothetical protein
LLLAFQRKNRPQGTVLSLEVDRDDKLPPIIEEMLRWRDIIGNDYEKHKSK